MSATRFVSKLDAHDLRSVSLAEKLGYRMSHPYTAYIQKEFIRSYVSSVGTA
jgi:hypothetical protein